MGRRRSFWHWLVNLGRIDDPTVDRTTSLMNQIAFFGIGIAILDFWVGLAIGISIEYHIANVILGATLAWVLILNRLRWFIFSRLMATYYFPAILSGVVLMVGGGFSEEIIVAILIFLIYLYYAQDSRQLFLALFLLALEYLSVSIYLFFFPPLLASVNNPYDNMVVFIMGTFWLVTVIRIYHDEVHKQHTKQEELIKTLRNHLHDLNETKEELEQFTYIASHDLKSPLQTILNFSQLIERDLHAREFENIELKLTFVKSAAEQMKFLVTDILEYSNMKGNAERKHQIVDLNTVAEKVVNNLTEIIQRKDGAVLVEELPDLPCNETEITMVFQNLIENALKYNTSAQPTVSIHALEEGESIKLHFADNGIGIEAQYFDRIFEFFKRLHTQDSYPGTGLGLWVCKKIVEGMEGTISLTSTVGAGSTFIVSLPVAPQVNPVPSE